MHSNSSSSITVVIISTNFNEELSFFYEGFYVKIWLSLSVTCFDLLNESLEKELLGVGTFYSLKGSVMMQ